MTRSHQVVLPCLLVLLGCTGPAWAGDPSTPVDWPVYRGTPGRNGIVRGGDLPHLEARWRKLLAEQSTTRKWIDEISRFIQEKKAPFLPAAFPITTTITTRDGRPVPLLIYRSHWGLYVYDLRSSSMRWRAPSAWSMDTMVSKPQKQPALTQWAEYYLQTLQQPTLLFSNGVVGTLSTDNLHVYAIEDLAVAPPLLQTEFDLFNRRLPPRYDPSVTDAIQHNRLQAYFLETGKLKWEVGGRNGGDLNGSFYLGAPLPLNDRLYVLLEKEGKIALVCLDAHRGGLLDKVDLYHPALPLLEDSGRRMQAAHLAFAEGRLICPTNAGAVVAVDASTHKVLWTYSYRKADPDQPKPVEAKPGTPRPSFWAVTAPIIEGNRVIFTAPDARSVHCIDLRTGKKVWTHFRQEGDLFLAGVFKDRVLLVGRHKVRALSLNLGKEQWSLEVGMPSGQGIASDTYYYLPLRADAKRGEPGVCAIDVARGEIYTHARSPRKEVPGNLIFAEGQVISQSLNEIVAYPQLRDHQAQQDALLKQNPDDPMALTDRGAIRLEQGDLRGAIADLSRAVKTAPAGQVKGRARLRLYEAFTAYFRSDFKSAQQFAKEYEEVCTTVLEEELPGGDAGKAVGNALRGVPQEALRRRFTFLTLVARGLESQRELALALAKYEAIGKLLGLKDLPPLADEPGVRVAADLWARDRIRALFAAAAPKERQALDNYVAQREIQARKNKSLNDLREFVRLFGSAGQAGKEARLRLVERLIEDEGPLSLLEAEQHLELLRGPGSDPEWSGRAVEGLARLSVRKGLLKDAGYYSRLLRRDFAQVPIRDGKTGADLFDEQTGDKRMLPYLDEPGELRSGDRLRVSEERGSFPRQKGTYLLGQAGEPLPFFQDHHLALRARTHSLHLLERPGGAEKWQQPLTETRFWGLVPPRPAVRAEVLVPEPRPSGGAAGQPQSVRHRSDQSPVALGAGRSRRWNGNGPV